MESRLKFGRLFPLLLYFLFFCSCEKISIDSVELELEYSWGTEPGVNQKNPDIKLSGIPPNTIFLKVQLVDLDLPIANHGEVEKITYSANGVIPYGSLKNYIGPSPPPEGHRYEYTIKALDENGVVIGIGKKAQRCCPETQQ